MTGKGQFVGYISIQLCFKINRLAAFGRIGIPVAAAVKGRAGDSANEDSMLQPLIEIPCD